MAVIKGIVVGRVKIKDLNICLEYKEEKSIPDQDFKRSQSLQSLIHHKQVAVVKRPVENKVIQKIITKKEDKKAQLKLKLPAPTQPPKQEIKVIEREVIKHIPNNISIVKDLQKFKQEIISNIKNDIVSNNNLQEFKRDLLKDIINIIKSNTSNNINERNLINNIINEISNKIKTPKVELNNEQLKNDIINSIKIPTVNNEKLTKEIVDSISSLLKSTTTFSLSPKEEDITTTAKSNEPIFIPKVKSDNVKSTIKIEEQKTESVDDSLAAIKKLKKKSRKKK